MPISQEKVQRIAHTALNQNSSKATRESSNSSDNQLPRLSKNAQKFWDWIQSTSDLTEDAMIAFFDGKVSLYCKYWDELEDKGYVCTSFEIVEDPDIGKPVGIPDTFLDTASLDALRLYSYASKNKDHEITNAEIERHFSWLPDRAQSAINEILSHKGAMMLLGSGGSRNG